MNEQWLVRYSEIFLKSDPVRRKWEGVLAARIMEVMPEARVRTERGRIWVEGDLDPSHFRTIFGIVSFSRVSRASLNDLAGILPGYCRSRGVGQARTFALRVKRIGTHPFTSHAIAVRCGDLIRNSFPDLKVDLVSPEKEIFIEIRGEDCYLYDTIENGPGGLPPGVEGTLVALVSGGIDSPVAAWMMMKRGARIVPLYIDLADVLDGSNYTRTERVIEALRAYQPDITLKVVNDSYLSKARQELAGSGQERYTCLLCKRRMYRIAETFARSIGAKGIVTGESLGQVASQTLDNLLVLDDAAEIPVYRPLIGLDKEEIIRIAREIRTFIPSTAVASGCTAVPAKPATKASLEKIRQIEQQISATLMKVPV